MIFFGMTQSPFFSAEKLEAAAGCTWCGLQVLWQRPLGLLKRWRVLCHKNLFLLDKWIPGSVQREEAAQNRQSSGAWEAGCDGQCSSCCSQKCSYLFSFVELLFCYVKLNVVC